MDFLSWVFEPVEYDQNEPLLIDATDPERSYSFNQIRKQVRELIAGLKAIGVQPGDCVCVNAFNDISYTVLYLGIIGAGAVFTGINPAYSSHEIAHHVSMVHAKVVIVEPRMLEATLVAAETCNLPRSRIFAFDVHDQSSHPDILSWSTLLQHGESDWVASSNPDTTVAAYQTSSGTSGLPKAAEIPHSYLIIQAQLRISGPSVNYEVRRLTALPPMHVFATPIVPACIRQGCKTYIMRRYEMADFIKAIEQYRISETFLPPPPLIAIPKSPLATKAALHSVRQIWMGGAGVSYQNQLPFYALLHPDARINQVWGMTEVGWVTQVFWPTKQMDNSVGTPLKGYRLRIVDDEGSTLRKPYSIGELQILAPHPMLGYLENTEASNAAFTIDSEGQWVNSGDVGYIDNKGNIFIVDRKKDLVKVRGWQVSPAEIEGRVLQHPDVLDVGVIGVPLPSGEGEVVRAYVVLSYESCTNEDDLKKFALVTLAKYKCPEEIIFTHRIPRNPTGKILRRLLREEAFGDKVKLEAMQTPTTSIISIDGIDEGRDFETQTSTRPRRGHRFFTFCGLFRGSRSSVSASRQG